MGVRAHGPGWNDSGSHVIIPLFPLKQLEGYFGADLVILKRGQMTRTIPEFALLSPSSRTKPTGRVTVNGLHTMELSFEPGILQPRSQDLAIDDPLAVARFMASTDHCLRPLPSGFLKLG
ncbi:hypothetical protein AVEN_241712-1, partial [Araneus ventricosus]